MIQGEFSRTATAPMPRSTRAKRLHHRVNSATDKAVHSGSLDNDLASQEARPGCRSLAGGPFGDEVSTPISVLGVHAKLHLVTGDFPLEDQRNGVALPLRID